MPVEIGLGLEAFAVRGAHQQQAVEIVALGRVVRCMQL